MNDEGREKFEREEKGKTESRKESEEKLSTPFRKNNIKLVKNTIHLKFAHVLSQLRVKLT